MTSEQIRLGIVTEIHIVPPGTPEGFWHNPFLFDQAEQLFARAVRRCQELEVDAIAILGDLTHFADEASFAGVRRVLETTALPVYVLPGNHDLDKSARPLAAFQQAMDLPNVTIAPANRALTPEIDLQLDRTGTGRRGEGLCSGALRNGHGQRSQIDGGIDPFPSLCDEGNAGGRRSQARRRSD